MVDDNDKASFSWQPKSSNLKQYFYGNSSCFVQIMVYLFTVYLTFVV